MGNRVRERGKTYLENIVIDFYFYFYSDSTCECVRVSVLGVCDTQEKTITDTIVIVLFSFHFISFFLIFFCFQFDPQKRTTIYNICSLFLSPCVCVCASMFFVRHLCDKYLSCCLTIPNIYL